MNRETLPHKNLNSWYCCVVAADSLSAPRGVGGCQKLTHVNVVDLVSSVCTGFAVASLAEPFDEFFLEAN